MCFYLNMEARCWLIHCRWNIYWWKG